MDEDRKFELMSEKASELDDGDLVDLVLALNEPTEVPPCRVCGADLQPGSMGGGMPTIFRCSSEQANWLGMERGTEERCRAMEHYDQSLFEDRRHTDPWAYELAKRIKAF